jgi:hypothetical protein
MMQVFEERIINNWAVRFQCPVSIINQSGTSLIPEEKYANQRMIIRWHIGKLTVAPPFPLPEPVEGSLSKGAQLIYLPPSKGGV